MAEGGRLDAVVQAMRKPPPAPTVISSDNVDAPTFGRLHILHAGQRPVDGATACGAQKLTADNARLPIDSDHAEAVLPHGADRPRYVRTMIIIVHGVGIVVNHVNAITIVYIAVP